MKTLLKKLLPASILSLYHWSLAYLGALIFRFPTRHMVVIGVTGTRGKTTTANLIWSVCTAAGYTTGLTGTANIRIGNDERMNHYHMTMPGRFAMQKLFAEMRRAGCEIVVVETPSEGIEQNRHRGIFYDALVLTTLYPEYLEIHGWSFDRLKHQIKKLFTSLSKMPRKKLRRLAIPKLIVVNADIEGYETYVRFPADQTVTYAVHTAADVRIKEIQPQTDGVSFVVDNTRFHLRLIGSFNVANALPAIALAKAWNLPIQAVRAGLEKLEMVPGRMEEVYASQPFTVFVDYAHDGPSIEAALRAAREIATARNGRLLILLGGEGGGRDKRKRPIMGELAAHLADIVVVSNVDPYDDDPMEIIEDIARASEAAGKTRGKNLLIIEDRREGIHQTLALAKANDVVLITGKGAEQSMILGSKTLPWDDRVIVREELLKLTTSG